MHQLQQDWQACFEDTVPVAQELIEKFKRRRIRFHSLPNSKQYPTSDNEWETLLLRANRIATEVLGEGGDCWVAASAPDLVLPSGQQPNAIARQILDLQFAWKWKAPFGDEEDDYPMWITHAKQESWHSGRYDELFREIAVENERDVCWFSPATRSIFYPYPGGIDVIARSPSENARLVRQYREWIPDYMF